jgi:hypothetical protein
MGAGCQQIVQRGGLCHHNSVAAAAVALANAVHDYQYNGFLHKINSKSEYIRRILHFIGHIILHHILRTYNLFFNFSVTHKNNFRELTKIHEIPGSC